MRTLNMVIVVVNSFLGGFLLAYGEIGTAAFALVTAVLCAAVALFKE